MDLESQLYFCFTTATTVTLWVALEVNNCVCISKLEVLLKYNILERKLLCFASHSTSLVTVWRQNDHDAIINQKKLSKRSAGTLKKRMSDGAVMTSIYPSPGFIGRFNSLQFKGRRKFTAYKIVVMHDDNWILMQSIKNHWSKIRLKMPRTRIERVTFSCLNPPMPGRFLQVRRATTTPTRLALKSIFVI